MAAALLNSLALSPSVMTAEQMRAELEFRGAARAFALGIPELDELLPSGGLPWGSVIELQACGASGAATSFALAACRAVQEQSGEARRNWCAFIDPGASLFAPGAAQLGVDLRRLLVVRPPHDAIERVAVRMAEARAVSLLVVDLGGAMGELSLSGHHWLRTVRRLSLAVKPLACSVLLLTRKAHSSRLQPHGAARWAASTPLPVAMRLELERRSAESFEVRVAKERTGHIGARQVVPWSAFRGGPVREAPSSAEVEPIGRWPSAGGATS